MSRRGPILRPEVLNMAQGEELIRAARRAVTNAERPTPEPIRRAASAMLKDAIAQLVAAHSELNPTETENQAEPASA